MISEAEKMDGLQKYLGNLDFSDDPNINWAEKPEK